MCKKIFLFASIILILFAVNITNAKEYIGVGIKSGIAVLQTKDNAKTSRIISLMVNDVMPNGPAERAGLKINDCIQTVNEKSLDNMTVAEILNIPMNILNEPEKKLVTLNILRLNENKECQEYEFKIKKELINW